MVLTLAVHDLDDTVYFYTHLLEQRLVRATVDGIAVAELLQGEQPRLRFMALADFRQHHPALHEAIDRHPLGPGLQISLDVEQPAVIKQALEKAGVHLAYELEDRPANRLAFWLRDPNDYLISVSGPLTTRFFA